MSHPRPDKANDVWRQRGGFKRGTLIERTAQTILQQVPQERRAETAATLVHLLKERLAACGITSDEDGDGRP